MVLAKSFARLGDPNIRVNPGLSLDHLFSNDASDAAAAARGGCRLLFHLLLNLSQSSDNNDNQPLSN